MKIDQKKDFIEKIKTEVTVDTTCKKLGLSRQTFYRWCKEDASFKKEIEKARAEAVDLLNDECENRVIKKIMNDDSGMIKFWLKHHHHDYKTPYIITR